MTPVSAYILVTFVALCGSKGALSGNVLVVPGEYSHWLNMRAMLEELVNRNHSVTVLVNSASPTVDYTRPERFHFEVFQVPFSKCQLHGISEELIRFWIYNASDASVMEIASKVIEVTSQATPLQMQACDAMLRDKELQDKLRRGGFHVLLSDPMIQCGDLLAESLGIPLIYSLRFSFGYTIERFCGQLPVPASYVPAAPGQYSDQMTFVERLTNVLMYAFHTSFFYIHSVVNWNRYYSDFLGRPTTVCDIMGKADVWLIRTYWDFEYPRPLLPNFQFVGGLHCQPAKPLPSDIEEFVQSSGDAGIVVVSFGTLIPNLTREKGNVVASALGQIPQKVLWKYSGEKPDTLAPNTRVYDWLPQNDLLGHPKTRAFVTHGGTNGIYEAIYHAVPMVGVPMFSDQPENVARMRNKGAAVVLDFNTMRSKDLVDALNTVINVPSYKESVMRLSRIHHDQPMKPLDRAVFWIEFVMRNKGAKHLRVQAHNLTWYQYHSLDVLTVLLGSATLALYTFLKTCKYCFWLCCQKSKAKNKTE
ncbi:UDP-glucuronosyltransferase 2A2-like isoform X1 [Paramormyrops kingsleyae]|uniref:UDP-glucuronosyltransferase 2A2-like isoform X1 n=2 Tax=Paramormyrops kingsleyae TaxID=1676925 RepID=UPI003B97C06F